MNAKTFVPRARFHVVRGVEREFHQRPSREAMTTFPSVSGVGAFVVTTTQPVVLKVVHEFKQVNSDHGLSHERQRKGPCQHGQNDHKRRLEAEDTCCVLPS